MHYFGPYRIVTRIATGGMAEVFAARHVSPDGRAGPLVALKRLLPHLRHDANVVRMFLNEARITAQIGHANVVRVLDLGHHEGEPYICMELLEGHSFAELRQQAAVMGARVPVGITLRILTDACRGLDAAHRAMDEEGRLLCIVHRDFTPDNIHVGADGRTKVIDFGIAKAQNLGAGTEPGTLKGKFFYMSPEMIAGRSVDHRADLYAAGVMLYEQLCGRRPFTGNTPDEVVRRIADGQLKKPTSFDPSIPPALEAICLMALERDPEMRFQSLKAFITAIESVGGAAELARPEAVAAYLERLIPVEDDERRALVRMARELDPSNAGRAPSPPAMAPERTPRPVAPSGRQAAPVTAAPASGPSADVPRRRRFPVVPVAVVLALLAIAGGAGVVFLKPPLPPAELLASAREEADRNARVSRLLKLSGAEDVTAPQLEEAISLLLAAKAPAEALALCDARLVRFEKTEAAHLLEARAAIAARQGKRALEAISAARALAPKSPEPDVVLAELREAQGDLHGAARAVSDALSRAKDADALSVRHGYLLSQAGLLDEAATALAALLKRKYDVDAAAELGFVRFRQDRSQEALDLLRRAVQRAPDHFRAHYYLGAVLFRRGDAAGAERAYQTAEKLAPEDPRPLVALCEVAGRNGNKALVAQTHARMVERFAAEAASLKAQCGF